jgi:hypothetical protein
MEGLILKSFFKIMRKKEGGNPFHNNTILQQAVIDLHLELKKLRENGKEAICSRIIRHFMIFWQGKRRKQT